MDKLFLVHPLEKKNKIAMAKTARTAGLQAAWLGQLGRLALKLHRHRWQAQATLPPPPLLGPNAGVGLQNAASPAWPALH